ncbi:thiamine phosphate synthase [Aneurinibacillus danicus]|uniref:Thiamine phosphate synthase n=2 Tax=Aneurinibacillus danicus TaxID=267746 RepID=A0A511V7N9_9BACL|nr:thiamine phosphate synthase [Aneurinibacillus danicus]
MHMAHALHVISSGTQSLSDVRRVVARIHPYITMFHLREKQRTARELWEWTQDLVAAGLPCTKLAVNDRVDVALASGAAAIQAAYHSLPAGVIRRLAPHRLIGVSVHSVTEAKAAEASGADYVLFGHVFASTSKPGQAGRGLAALQEIVESVNLPVIALGGITPNNAPDTLATGCAGIAVLSAIMLARDPMLSAQQFQQAMQNVRVSPRCAWPMAKMEGVK